MKREFLNHVNLVQAPWAMERKQGINCFVFPWHCWYYFRSFGFRSTSQDAKSILNAASDKSWNVILFQVFHLFQQDKDLDTKEIELLCVMNHIPLHPFAIKSHPNLIPSLSNLPPMFPPFPPFPDTPSLRCSVTHHSLLRHPSPITCHLSHHHSVIPLSLFFIISFCHYRPSLFRISSAPIKFRASFSVMWLDDHHLNIFTFLWRTITLLFLWSYDFILSNLVLLSSVPIYLRISVYKELLHFSKTPVCNRLKPIHPCFVLRHPHCLPSPWN